MLNKWEQLLFILRFSAQVWSLCFISPLLLVQFSIWILLIFYRDSHSYTMQVLFIKSLRICFHNNHLTLWLWPIIFSPFLWSVYQFTNEAIGLFSTVSYSFKPSKNWTQITMGCQQPPFPNHKNIFPSEHLLFIHHWA